ncbi:MAG: hypothetical protein V9F00_04765 [Nocardioides sp.]
MLPERRLVTQAGLLNATWERPQGWLVLTGDEQAWIASVLAEYDGGNVSALRDDLRRFVGMAAAADRPGGRWIANLSPSTTVHNRVVAAGSIHLAPAIDLAVAERALRDSEWPPQLVSRRVITETGRRRSSLGCYELVVGTGSSGETLLIERCAVLTVHHSAAVTINLVVSTSDVGAFEDLSATCLAMAKSFRFDRP